MHENKVEANKEGPSKMAEGIAMHRISELGLPEDIRACYDPYAIYFLSPETLKILKSFQNDPQKAKTAAEEHERLYPGFHNSIVARVKYFDNFVEKSIDEGIEQIVALGAGYDTRAYRIEGLNDIKVFEVDHPDTQRFKIEKLKEIFDSVPEHVAFIPVDFEKETFGQKLFDKGYDKSLKTLFILEGLTMYIPQNAVAETLNFIVENSGKGSIVIFDYIDESVIDGTSKLEIGKNLRDYTKENGAPLQFGIKEEEIEAFLTQFGFSRIQNVTSDDYKKACFSGKNEIRNVSSILYFAHAVVE